MAYDNANSGALFKNDKDGNDKRPDYRGTLNVDGADYWLSAWIKIAKSGDKFMSLQVQAKNGVRREPAKQAPAKTEDPFDDDIPF